MPFEPPGQLVDGAGRFTYGEAGLAAPDVIEVQPVEFTSLDENAQPNSQPGGDEPHALDALRPLLDSVAQQISGTELLRVYFDTDPQSPSAVLVAYFDDFTCVPVWGTDPAFGTKLWRVATASEHSGRWQAQISPSGVGGGKSRSELTDLVAWIENGVPGVGAATSTDRRNRRFWPRPRLAPSTEHRGPVKPSNRLGASS